MSPADLIARFITCDYRGQADQKACAVELLQRIEGGELSIQDAIVLIQKRP
jgi:hypothetical protein